MRVDAALRHLRALSFDVDDGLEDPDAGVGDFEAPAINFDEDPDYDDDDQDNPQLTPDESIDDAEDQPKGELHPEDFSGRAACGCRAGAHPYGRDDSLYCDSEGDDVPADQDQEPDPDTDDDQVIRSTNFVPTHLAPFEYR